MAQKKPTKKIRKDLDPAHALYYEDWLEPDWRENTVTTPASSGPKDPKLKDRSKFKFANEYTREISTNGSNLKRSQSANNLKNAKNWIYHETARHEQNKTSGFLQISYCNDHVF